MTHWPMRRLARALLLLIACSSEAAAAQVSFGEIRQGDAHLPITWEPDSSAEFAPNQLRLRNAGQHARSTALPLDPLQLYEVRATMQRGPGTSPHFTLVYVDAQGEARLWHASWQLPHATHPNWLPLSPHRTTYVQSFVLPKGATGPHFELSMDMTNNPKLARYGGWEVTQLHVTALRRVVCCEQLGPDLLGIGDFETPGSEGLPMGWTQWNARPETRVSRIELADKPAHNHAMRVRANTSAILAATSTIAVQRGSAFRIRVCARGRGRIQLAAFELTDDTPVPQRVGGSVATTQTLDTVGWRHVTSIWFAEATHVASVRVVIAVDAQTDVELDKVELRAFE